MPFLWPTSLHTTLIARISQRLKIIHKKSHFYNIAREFNYVYVFKVDAFGFLCQKSTSERTIQHNPTFGAKIQIKEKLVVQTREVLFTLKI